MLDILNKKNKKWKKDSLQSNPEMKQKEVGGPQ